MSLRINHEIRGSGVTGRRRLHKVHHRVNQSSLILVKNPPGDTRCLMYALELTRRHNTRQHTPAQFYRYLHKQMDQQARDVTSLMNAANIPSGQSDYEAAEVVPRVVDYWNEIYAREDRRFKVFIFGEIGDYRPKYMYGPDDFTHPISLYHADGHFDGVRSNAGIAVFGRDYYCYSCLCPYDRAVHHRSSCKAKCLECGRIGTGANAGACKPDGSEPRFCAGCGKTFNNENCWRHHTTSNYCQISKRCHLCSKVYSTTRLGKQPHDCLRSYCVVCFRWHKKEEPCYITPLENKPLRPYRLIIYDFECTQDHQVQGSDPPRYSHAVNFASLMVMCPACISSGEWRKPLLNREPCKFCGPYRTVTFSHNDFHETEVDHKIICSVKEPLDAFVDHLLSGFDHRYESICFAHNAGRYDTVLMHKAFYNHPLRPTPTILRKGNKIFELSIKKTANNPAIKLRDSLNLLPVSLERLVGAFGLETGDKEFFPHAFNTTTNYNLILHDRLPPKEDYFYGSFSPEKKKRFEEWWEENQHLGFNLVEALPSYCCSDVRILAEALVAFRQEWWEISISKREEKAEDQLAKDDEGNESDEAMDTYLGNEDEELDLDGPDREYEKEVALESKENGMDVLYEAMTISSACVKYFRRRYLKENHLVLISNWPIDSTQTQSKLALKYLEWLAEKHQIHIQTAHSPGGEKKFGPYTVDGYFELPDDGRKVIVEIFGDVWHACPVHFPDPEMVMKNGKTAGRIRSDDERRLAYLRQCVDEVLIVWECQIMDALRENKHIREAFDQYHDKGAINIREAFMGGRTEAHRMHFKCPEGWTISDLDCNSMYPHVMVTGSFPVSVPKVHVIGHPDYIVDWRSSADIPMKGILKVFVIPPHHIDIPVLPAKFDDRLCFALCRTCALKYPRGGIMPEYECRHSDEERGWVATLPHIELAAALDAGYRITRFYRALEFEKFDSALFAPFVRDFMAMKIESSGFPAGVETREQQDIYIQECWDKFGIRVDRNKIKPNKARRECAKLILNNIWAKFSQVPGLSTTDIIDSAAKLRKLFDDPKIEISAIDELNEKCSMVTYKYLDDMQEEHTYHNPIISLWCTSLARVQLLEKLRAVKRDPDSILLYLDTDSGIVAHRIGHCPIRSGPHLGEWKDELPGYIVVEFLSGGCKNYVLRCIDRQTGKEKHILHVRGISLTADVCEKLHWDTYKECIMHYASLAEQGDTGEFLDTDGQIMIEYPRALRPSVKDGAVYTVPIKKWYRPIVTKGVVIKGGIIRPFGYKSDQ